jgi:hypothetical protein
LAKNNKRCAAKRADPEAALHARATLQAEPYQLRARSETHTGRGAGIYIFWPAGGPSTLSSVRHTSGSWIDTRVELLFAPVRTLLTLTDVCLSHKIFFFLVASHKHVLTVWYHEFVHSPKTIFEGWWPLDNWDSPQETLVVCVHASHLAPG